MTPASPSASRAATVFEREQQIAQRAEAFAAGEEAARPPGAFASEYALLAKEYRSLLGQAEKVTKLGDAAQRRLMKAQERIGQMLREIERAYAALEESQRQLEDELDEAAAYICSILPAPCTKPVAIDWIFRTCTQLGGDAFGYHWLDSDHFAVYLLDVSGHGVGATLLSVAAINVLRSGSLASTDFREPAQVLARMNEAFQMERQNFKYFTLWYAVYAPATRRLVFGGAGHPAPVLFSPASPGEPVLLKSSNLVIGALADCEFRQQEATIPAGARLFVFSDGAYEIMRREEDVPVSDADSFWEYHDFLAALARCDAPGEKGLLPALEAAQAFRGTEHLADDYSLLRLQF